MKKEKRKTRRVTIDVDVGLHKKLKMLAVQNEMTLTELVVAALEKVYRGDIRVTQTRN